MNTKTRTLTEQDTLDLSTLVYISLLMDEPSREKRTAFYKKATHPSIKKGLRPNRGVVMKVVELTEGELVDTYFKYKKFTEKKAGRLVLMDEGQSAVYEEYVAFYNTVGWMFDTKPLKR